MTKGQRIRHLRESKDISLTDCAITLGLSKQTLYKYEQDIITNIPSDVIERMAVLFEVSPAYIMGWEKDRDSRLKEYLKAFSGMTPEQVDSVFQFIDFIKHKEDKDEK